MSAPTVQAYAEIQRAFQHFNRDLFGSTLPDCLLTLQRKRRSFGYFSARKFVAQDGQVAHEIALNPSFFAVRSVEEVLSTLVHEMAHLRDEERGTSGRGRYHNRAWANGMIELGLHPSSTGQPGGKETGDRVSHYVVENGEFIASCRRLLDADFLLSWHERVLSLTAAEAREPVRVEGMAELSASPYHEDASRYEVSQDLSGDASGRMRYVCPGCDLLLWGRAGVAVKCIPCDRTLVPSRASNGRVVSSDEHDEEGEELEADEI